MFIIGHSHVAKLEQAAGAMGLSFRSLNLWGFGQPVLYDEETPRLAPELASMIDDDLVISAVGGSAHDMIGLAQHPRRFDLVLPGRPDLPLDAEAEIVPAEAVSDAISRKLEPIQLDLIRALKAPGRRVIHVESPPPSPPGERLNEEMQLLLFAGGAKQASSAWLRFKLWRLHSDIIRRGCEAAGVEFAPHPEAALVEGVYLRPELYAYACHANAGYGELVLRALGFGGTPA